ncbi:RHS repeat-associated core domain-containing protein [uncultured Tateyamaria sp.]|uniref:RHS repeat domain-containing protein n=1 Tax=Tateyamaria sp. 1078 TaxID=3417464 RepID=UPI0026341277|nr:RHS repeat-associated core domain-containing protein [uncultured Tateyamaria sp.]
MTRLEHAQSGVALTDLSYAYGPDAQLTSILDNLDPSKSKAIAYDDLNRLVQVAEGVPVAQGGVPIPVEDYAYDQEGNRLASHLSALYSSNAHNQLLEDDDFTYAYDAKGNRVSKTSKLDGSVETYSYDSQNRLVGYASPTVTASYAYDALDRRIGKMVDGDHRAYIYDISEDYPLRFDDIALEFGLSVAPLLERRWLHSNHVDEPLGFEAYGSVAVAGSGTNYSLLSDRQASTLKVVENQNNDVVATYEYDGFGQILLSQENLAQPYRYSGREFDSESRLYHLRARTYDPALGNFLQDDPIGFASDQFNLYQYAYSDPFNYFDPTGYSGTATKGILTAGASVLAVDSYVGVGTSVISLSGSIARVMAFAAPAIVLTSSTPDENYEAEQESCDLARELAEKAVGEAFERCMLTASLAPTPRNRRIQIANCKENARRG